MKNKRTYEESVHYYGRIWMLSAFVLLMAIPIIIGVAFSAWPPLDKVLLGLLGVVPMFWTVAVIEVLTFSPMLGNGGTYLGFVTGNLTNMKVPCALNAMKGAGVEPGSPEGEIISTIAIASSTFTNTIVLTLGVLLLVPLTPILSSPSFKPMFDNILPALFGGLGVAFIAKDWKVATLPLGVMILLYILAPTLPVGILIPVSAAIAISWARFLYKKGHLHRTHDNKKGDL